MRIAIKGNRLVQLLLALFLSTVCFASDTVCFFLPPSNWELAHPSHLSPHVKVGFIGKNRNGFCPSINLAEEAVDVTLEKYLQTVRKIHERRPGARWRDLGPCKTRAGIGRLTEIELSTEWGEARLLQLILMKDKKAYILTAAASKEEFRRFYPEFQTACQTLHISDDLLACISEENRRRSLEDKTLAFFLTWQEWKESGFFDPEFQKKVWLPFQQTVINDCKEMGAYWQILYLQTIQKLL